MRTYWAFARVGMLDALQYPAEAVIWFLFDLLPPVTMVFVWLSVYQGRSDVAGYSLDQMLGYYIGILILGTLLTAHIEWGISDEVRTGELSPKLVRPVSPWVNWFMGNLSWRIMRGLFLIPSVSILAVALHGYLHVPTLSAWQVAVLALTLVLAYLLCFVLKALLGMLAFWLTELSAISGLWEATMFVFGGTLLPLEMLPGPLQTLAALLPFKYIFAFPLTLALGRTEGQAIWTGLAIQAGWLLLALLALRLAWPRALRRYEAVGR